MGHINSGDKKGGISLFKIEPIMKLYAGFRKHLRAVIGWNLTPSPDIVVIMRYR